MGKPSMFSSNYKQQIKKRRLNAFLFVLLLVCIGFFGGKYYLNKNNISIIEAMENNKIVKSTHIPDILSKIGNVFTKDEKSDSSQKDITKDTSNSGKTAESTSKSTSNKDSNIKEIGKVKDNTTSLTTSEAVGTANNTSSNITTAEYVYLAKNGYRFAVQYQKSGNRVEIKGLKETTNTSDYSISKNKDMITFDVKQDNTIVLCDAAGVFKIISRDKYKSTTSGKVFEKDTVLNNYVGYIWAQKPYFTLDGRVVYISRIPYFKSSKTLYLWSVSLDGKTHKRITKIGNDINKVKYDGYDEQNRLKVIVDGTTYYLNNGSYMLREQ
jgi:hypothetical protein